MKKSSDQSQSSRTKRTTVGLLGGIVLLIGVITIPYPGPGWLTVFAGLGILATEFDWAQRALDYARERCDAWEAWLKRQPLAIKMVFWMITATIVVGTIWLLNGYGLINQWFDLGQEWLVSPLFV